VDEWIHVEVVELRRTAPNVGLPGLDRSRSRRRQSLETDQDFIHRDGAKRRRSYLRCSPAVFLTRLSQSTNEARLGRELREYGTRPLSLIRCDRSSTRRTLAQKREARPPPRRADPRVRERSVHGNGITPDQRQKGRIHSVPGRASAGHSQSLGVCVCGRRPFDPSPATATSAQTIELVAAAHAKRYRSLHRHATPQVHRVIDELKLHRIDLDPAMRRGGGT